MDSLKYYHHLSLSQQILYKKMHDAITRQDEYIICGEKDCSENHIHEVFNSLILDNPVFFYVRPNDFVFEKTSWGIVKVWPKYFFSKEEKQEIENEINKRKDILLEKADLYGKDQGEVVKCIHDVLIKNTTIKHNYDVGKVGDCTIVGTLLDGNSTSESISITFKFLLDELNFSVKVVNGYIYNKEGKTIPHSWNTVQLYGAERHTDVFADALYSHNNTIKYNFFCLTEEMIKKDHFLEFPGEIKNTDVVVDDNENDNKEKSIELDSSKGETIESIQIEKITLESGISVLVSLPTEYIHENLTKKLNRLVILLKQVQDVELQYPNEKDTFDEYIMRYLPDLIMILQEYCRYGKLSASQTIISLLFEKITDLIKDFEVLIQSKLDLFWNERAREILSTIGGVQEDIQQEKQKRKSFPFDIKELEKKKDIKSFIEAFEFLNQMELPSEISNIILMILNGLKRMKKRMKNNDVYDSQRFFDYYFPEAIELILIYDEYRESGMEQNDIEEIYKKIQVLLHTINSAITNKLNEIYRYAAIDTKARMDALTEIIKQDGY